ncbi:tetratricopeptide repeat-containing sensor histidine kinase [Flavobacterium nackdongense]|uniref:histidine kinase n=1 Tax=Flavobacterium nackdongense TaxID=2547394 RepID=A0A4P6YCP8_9FLAO|nr:sensor histidine kinase [Flavobacterium nackdongense]QBN18634.1 tetratricopeptide repeat protein [Flavobacterium nackdongense]
MKKYCYLLILLIVSFSANAQKSEHIIDSLKKSLNKGNSSKQFKTLTNLSDEYSNSDLDKAEYYSYKALSKAIAIKNDSFVALSYNNIGNIHQYKSELDSALYFHKKALQIRQKNKDFIGIADSYNNIGIVFDTKAQFPQALTNYFKALHYYELNKNFGKQAMVNTNIGIVYKAQKEYKKALVYYQNAYNLYRKAQSEIGITISSGNLGSILINFKKYKESLKYSELAKNGYKKLGYDRYVCYPIFNIAVVYDSLHQYETANKYYVETIQLYQKYNNSFEIAEATIAYANCLTKQKKFEESIAFSHKGIDFAKKSQAHLLLIEGYKNLSKANASIGKYNDAYYYSTLYNTGKDSLFAEEKTKAVFELETKYQTEKKEKLLLEKEAEAKQKQILLIGLSLLTFFIALIGFLIYRQQKLKNTQQAQEFELKSAISLIESQNKLQEQRLNISRDLHDNIGAQLTFIISSVDNIKYAFEITNEKLDNKLSNISSFAKETILELRDTIWAMNSNEITFEDLEIRINNYIEKAKEAKDQISFSFAIDEILKPQKLTSIQGMNIYRTIQEAVNNSIKYAHASVISINVKPIENRIKITVQDNGLGFDVKTIEKGNGLLNMQKRIEEIGGEFHLSSSNEGTQIEIVLKNKEI